MEIDSDLSIIFANDTELWVFRANFLSGHYNVVWTGPYHTVVPARASTNAFLTYEKECYICDMH